MDSDVALYSQARFEEIRDEMVSMLQKVGWKKDFLLKNVPILPISGWKGDNLRSKSPSMPWWQGCDVMRYSTGEEVRVHTLYDALNDMACPPPRLPDAAMR